MFACVGWSAIDRPATAARAMTGGLSASFAVFAETALERRVQARNIRESRARAWQNTKILQHLTNADHADLEAGIWAFSKCLPHIPLGEAEPVAWRAMAEAIKSGREGGWEAVIVGSPGKFADPLGGLAFSLEGPDSTEAVIPPSPRFSSAEQAADLVELYWRALARDVPFASYSSSGVIQKATEDLTRLTAYSGPRREGRVNSDVVFRGGSPGEATGPLLSQFFWKDVPWGGTLLKQRYRTAAAEDDFLTDYSEWLAVQNGHAPTRRISFDPTYRYIRNLRDLAAFVHRDFTYQAFLNAALILLELGLGALADSNPFKRSVALSGFVTFGQGQTLDWMARVCNSALKAAWFQKWSLHLRLRPEEFAGRVNNHLLGRAAYPIHSELLNSPVVEMIRKRYGSYLLPQAYPDGCPVHPSYPAGHAAVAGACATVLKALFDEGAMLPDSVAPNEDGTGIVPLSGPALTVGGELNKLASNVAFGRDSAGIHYRSDGTSGLLLGEAVAIGILRDLVWTLPQPNPELTLTRFNGQRIVIRKADDKRG